MRSGWESEERRNGGTEGNCEVEGEYRKRNVGGKERKKKKKIGVGLPTRVRDGRWRKGMQPPDNCEWGFGFLIDCFVCERECHRS